MTEEPYRWLETIGHRREYIRDQLESGTPVFAISRKEGVVLFGAGQGLTKVFEIYDRHGFAAFGHPVDIEKLRQLIIQAAHLEAFNRSGDDVTLRRLVNFSISPALKSAFDQIFSPPLIVESLLAEVGPNPRHDTLMRIHFDGDWRQVEGGIAVAARNEDVENNVAKYLKQHLKAGDGLKRVCGVLLHVWKIIVKDRHFVDVKAPPKQIKLALEDRQLEIAILRRDPKGRNHFEFLDPKSLTSN